VSLIKDLKKVYGLKMKKPQGNVDAGWYDAPEIEGYFQFWNGKFWTKHKRLKGDFLPEELPHPIAKSFLESIKHTLVNTFNYKGRASVREYWLFQLAHWAPVFLTAIIFADAGFLQFIPAILLWGLIPTEIALFVRRCHDSNKRGWWYFIPIGNIVVLFLDSDQFENRFGEPTY
jgi:uncharacterized membrane protein YhaH (DUF805 family)